MESKLTAQLVIVLFITLSVIGIVMRYVLGYEFSLSTYFQYIMLLAFMLMLLGKPLIQIALDLIRPAYRQNDEHFPVPGKKLKDTDQSAQSD
ncbi:MAG: hypothetical protein HQL32_11160 [Planctomycetes bacterium]|nr:hypothetical protein [Planctomycetota bacterium]